jgi:hypothetical protein
MMLDSTEGQEVKTDPVARRAWGIRNAITGINERAGA